jgi:hypothetical protein
MKSAKETEYSVHLVGFYHSRNALLTPAERKV